MRTDLDDCVKLIKSKKIRDFVEKALEKAPKEFWIAPASSTGKNHPPENNVKGGLVVHTRKLLRVSKTLFEFFGIQDQLLKDKIFAADIIHDIKKGGDPWEERTHLEHGSVAARWLTNIIAIEKYPEKEDIIHVNEEDRDLMDIIELVREHMGNFNSPLRTPALIIGQPVAEKSICHLIVQLSDLIASRIWLSFTF